MEATVVSSLWNAVFLYQKYAIFALPSDLAFYLVLQNTGRKQGCTRITGIVYFVRPEF
jgi:hypothetical protein